MALDPFGSDPLPRPPSLSIQENNLVAVSHVNKEEKPNYNGTEYLLFLSRNWEKSHDVI